MRGNFGYDRELFAGFLGTAEFVWSKTIKDIKYQNLNFAASPTVKGVGGRPFFIRQVASLSDVVLLCPVLLPARGYAEARFDHGAAAG